jgi:hypothetical protein
MRTNDLTKLVTFHDNLNQELWDGTELRKDVQLQLLKIAKEFVKFIKVPGLKLEDVTISGSNVSYNYNDQSDIDLHLIVDGEGPCWDHLNELFLAKKNLFNDEHDIQIKGHDVELYVQDKNQPHISNGIYSIVRDSWVKKPQQITADPDKTNIQHKYNNLKHIIDSAIDSGSIERMTRVQEKIKNYRQSGLNKHGEFGPENLAFKMLRNEGLLQRLFDAKLEAMDRGLSLTESAQADHQKILNAVMDFYRENTEIKPVEDFEAASQALVDQADTPALKSKLRQIFDKAKDNPYVQGGIITTIGSLIAGGVLGMGQRYGLTPHQTNIVLQAIINTVLPTIISRVNGKNWKDTIKYTLASAGIGTGIAALGENFADGKGPGRPGDSQRHGIPKGATIAQLEKASHAKGRKGQLARWQLNMRRGHKKEESVVAEKWSQKYKRSIDCSHPKGFSQKAHCAGRKKTNESILGDDMLKMFHQTHHEAGENPEMEQFIRDHAWGIKMIHPDQLPEIDDEVYFDDPFRRVMDIDDDQVRDVIRHVRSGGKIDPIIMGPGNSIIDGNHRAQAAKKLRTTIQAYVPMEQIKEFHHGRPHNKIITEPFKDPVAVLRKNLDKMKSPNSDKIDLLMLKIANRQGIGADLLHKMWVDKYKKTPDAYCGIKKVDTED